MRQRNQLVLGVAPRGGLGFSLPVRRPRPGPSVSVARPMTLMTRGRYAEPTGAWLPSVIC